MIEIQSHENEEERRFGEFRRKVRSAEVLSIHFNGRLSIIVQNGHVLKSGYEEGYFRQTETEVTTRLQ